MFRVHVIDKFNKDRYADQLEQQFRLRHDIYIGERGWMDIARADGREIDQFDNDDAIYLLGITSAGEVVGGSRLVPSLKPHLMSEVFPNLAPGGVPRGKGIYEWTRIFVAPALRTPSRPALAAGLIYCGIQEYCVQSQIENLSIVCETYWIDRLASLGWKPQLLGPVYSHQGSDIVGLISDTNTSALNATRGFYGIGKPVLQDIAGEQAILEHQHTEQKSAAARR